MSDNIPPDSIPEGFIANTLGPYSSLIGPLLYRRFTDEQGRKRGEVGLLLEPRHIGGNNRGHGGLLMTLLDESMGMNAYLQKDRTPTVTVSMTTQFIGPMIPGQFLYATGEIIQLTSTMAFMEGKAFCGGKLVGTGHGVWKYLHSKRTQPAAQDNKA